jgi:leishmanolysin-like peptidase
MLIKYFCVLRKCENNQVFYRKGEPYPYCKNACEARTMCGEVQVPEHHLEVCIITCYV